MFILFLSSVCGFVFVSRIFAKYPNNFANQRGAMTKIGTLFLLWGLFLVLFFNKNEILVSLLLFVPAILSFLFSIFAKFRMNEQKNQKLIHLLENCLCRMRLGYSLESSLNFSANLESNNFFRQKFVEFTQLVAFSPHSESIVQDIQYQYLQKELGQIRKFSHFQIEKIQYLLNKMKSEFDFRRRSGQVLSQIRLQVLLISFMYLALIIYIFVNFRYQPNLVTILFISIVLYFIGVFLMFKIGNRQRWRL